MKSGTYGWAEAVTEAHSRILTLLEDGPRHATEIHAVLGSLLSLDQVKKVLAEMEANGYVTGEMCSPPHGGPRRRFFMLPRGDG